MRKICVSVVALIILSLMILINAHAENAAQPFASDDIVSSSVSLKSNKYVSYDVVATRGNANITVNSCKLYKKNGDKWESLGSMKKAIPDSCTGQLQASCDVSSYITSSGTYRVEASITVGSTTVTKTSSSVAIK